MKRYAYMNMPDRRPVDVWGKPIGKPYEKKEWEELLPEEMQADFEWKSDILATYGEEVDGSTFYQDYLFRELYEGTLDGDYKVLLTEYEAEEGQKVHKIDVDEIHEYLHLNDVALSPCLFYKNWRMKKLLNYIPAFVLDIDKLRPSHLQRFFRLFEEGRLLTPTFIANSGSGVHFYYVLDQMVKCDSGQNEANNLIAEEIYRRLYDDVKEKEKWKDAQRHWLGQDYRVVNSKTKFQQTSRIFKTGELYTFDQLIQHYDVKIDPERHYASKAMVKYASNIARELNLDPPDFSHARETYAFIRDHKDAAYQKREARRQERRLKAAKKGRNSSKTVTWYRNTFNYMMDHTMPGYRFSSMKALAIIAFKEQVPRDVFVADIRDLTAYWEVFDWKGDKFNTKNADAIIRLFDNGATYSNTSSKTLEEWLGYGFRRIGNKRNGRKQKDHLARARVLQDFDDPNGSWRNKEGAPTKKEIVDAWQRDHPYGKKADCIRDTGLSRPTVKKWWKDMVATADNTEL